MSNTPVSMRLPEADIAIIDRAAQLRGRSRTDFVRDAAMRAAEEVIMESLIIRMSPEGFAYFVFQLDAAEAKPEAPTELIEKVRRLAPWEPGYTPPKR